MPPDVTQWLAPNLSLASAFAILAGTDLDRYRQFEAQSRHFQLQLRDFFYPRLHREVVSPTPQRAYGHFSFTDFESVPRFEMRDAKAADRVRASLATLGWLLLLSGLFATIGIARLRRWPAAL